MKDRIEVLHKYVGMEQPAEESPEAVWITFCPATSASLF